MNEEDTVKSLLKELIMFNTSDPDKFTSTDATGTHPGTIKDLMDLNLTDLISLADLLGMDELYLGDK